MWGWGGGRVGKEKEDTRDRMQEMEKLRWVKTVEERRKSIEKEKGGQETKFTKTI